MRTVAREPPALALQVDPASAASDERLAPVLELVRARQVEVVSLDFFDTLCGRAVPRPSAAFPCVGEALAEAGLLAPAIPPAAFGAVRIGAEARARRRRRATTEVTLAEIYAELPDALLPAGRRAEACAIELRVERDLAILDPSVAALAARAQAHGIRVAIVSDTYFSAAELRDLLRGAGAAFVPDVVLTSSDERTCKCDRLFDVLVARAGVPPARIAHLGDNPDSDVAAARRAGLRAYHLPRETDELRAVRVREAALPLARPGPDGGLAYLRGRAAWRAAAAAPGLEAHFRIGATVFGPLLTAFADWVVDRLEARGAGGALCFMREGEFLGSLVGAAARARGRALRLSPFWISRQAAFRASIGALDEAVVRAALVRRTAPTAATLCASLGIEPGAAGLRGAILEARLDREGLIADVVEALLAPGPRARVEEGAREQRAMLLELLARAAPSAGPIACLDLGWGATTQRYLAAALRLERSERPVLGLYLAATARASEAILEGSEALGFLTSPGEHEELGELLARSPEVLEQMSISPVGTALAYARGEDGRARPVLDACRVDPAGERERAAVRAGISFFQAQHLALARGRRLDVDELRRVLARFLARPLPSEAMLVGHWRHDDDFGSDEGGEIAPPVGPEPLGGRSAAQLYWDRSLYWPAGTAARSGPRLAEELAGYMLLGLFGPGATPAQQASARPVRHQIVDRLDTLVRLHAPAFHRAASALAARRAQDPLAPPLRYRAVDALNAYLKRVAPAVHARSKVTAAGALEPPGVTAANPVRGAGRP